MSNIAEGFGRFHKKEFIRFLYIAEGSAVELESQLYITLDLDYINEKQFSELRKSISSTQQTLLGLIRYLRNYSSDNTQVKEPEFDYSLTHSDSFPEDLPEKFIRITEEE
jgi:hypothetical protein